MTFPMSEVIAPRGPLPSGIESYRSIGPFDAASFPKGLRAEHRLKEGAWAIINLTQGSLRFVWMMGRGA